MSEDYAEEKSFVKAFIRKDRQERILFELTDPRREFRGLERFCHHSGEIIDRRKILLMGDDLERQEEFLKFIEEHDERCKVLSPEFCPDDIKAPLKRAVGIALASMDAVLILGNGFALVFGESMRGGREKYLLTE